jgi:predicted nucleic acid-binding protein
MDQTAASRVLGRLDVRDLRDVFVAQLPDEQRVLQAGPIRSEFALAYADAFAAATTLAHDAELWTGDPARLSSG